VLISASRIEVATRWQVLAISGTQVAALATWFSASAVSPALQQEFQLGAGQAALLTSSVQIGFVAGAVTSAALNLPDRWNLPRLYGFSALLAAGCTALFPLLAHGATSAVLLRLLTGYFLAGVYPVGMKLMASWAPPAIRGRAFGLLVAALTIGSAVPHLIRGAERLPWHSVMLVAAAVAATGGVVALTTLRTGPGYESRRQRLQVGYAIHMFRQRRARLANVAYFGHMWELYALWTWLPAYVLASQTARQGSTGGLISLICFTVIGVAGALGCLVGGWASDRVGRAPTAIVALVVSGACCLLSPLFFGAGTAVLTIYLLVWGCAVIADSGVFSTALSESVDTDHIGTALTTQTAVGFSLTVVTIQLVPVLASWWSWQYAFVVLAAGPVVGVAAMARFRLTRAPSRGTSSAGSREQEGDA
jgi:MFS family permease